MSLYVCVCVNVAVSVCLCVAPDSLFIIRGETITYSGWYIIILLCIAFWCIAIFCCVENSI